MSNIFAAPGTVSLGQRLTRDAAERIAGNWWRLLLNGAVLIVAGVLIFSIDWSVRSLATFIGALFIFEGIAAAVTSGLDVIARRTNLITGLLSVAAGVAIIVWPTPGLVAVAVFLGAWLIVVGTMAITGAFAIRNLMPDWWLWLVLGLLEVALGVLALADPGATLAALITVAGIWAVGIGVLRVILAFQVKDLPKAVDEALAEPTRGARPKAEPAAGPAANAA
jgi:uncharacterized membrane protein HdeD (DUF308 family)